MTALNASVHPSIERFNKMLYKQLVSCLSGESHNFVKNGKRGCGIAVWREIVHCYDPLSNVDKSAAYALISHPTKRAKTIQEARELITNWEGLATKYETRHEKISDVAKITAMKFMLPEAVLLAFRGKVCNEFIVYRQDIENFMNDKHSTSGSGQQSTPMDIDSVVAAAVADATQEWNQADAQKHVEPDLIAYAAGAAVKAYKGGQGKN